MTEEALTALKKSIEHWEKIVAGDEAEIHRIGMRGCALCEAFHPYFYSFWEKDENHACRGCPVAQRTGEGFCIDTPYEEFENSKWEPGTPEFQRFAERELSFLRSLLPETK
jgi:hypothetical protein